MLAQTYEHQYCTLVRRDNRGLSALCSYQIVSKTRDQYFKRNVK